MENYKSQAFRWVTVLVWIHQRNRTYKRYKYRYKCRYKLCTCKEMYHKALTHTVREAEKVPRSAIGKLETQESQ